MPPKLLLADDSVTIQRVIELTFADEDVVVTAVGDGQQAIARVQADPPDIVLADDTGVTRIGEGFAIRRADSGTALMIALDTVAKSGAILCDTVPVVLSKITYKSLRIYILDNGPKYPDTVRIRTDGSLTLFVN